MCDYLPASTFVYSNQGDNSVIRDTGHTLGGRAARDSGAHCLKQDLRDWGITGQGIRFRYQAREGFKQAAPFGERIHN